jgi:hypothetical protein
MCTSVQSACGVINGNDHNSKKRAGKAFKNLIRNQTKYEVINVKYQKNMFQTRADTSIT